MSKYIIEGKFIKFNEKHNGRIYDEKIFSREISKWKFGIRRYKIEKSSN
jgi:hypothetical protein